MSNYCVPYKPFGVIKQPSLAFKPKFDLSGNLLPLVSHSYDKSGKLEGSKVNLDNVDINSPEVTSKVNLLRDDDYRTIGTVGKGYNVVTHQQVEEGLKDTFHRNNVIVDWDRSEMLMNKLGSKLWMYFVLPEHARDIDGTGLVAPQIILKHALDGTGSLSGTAGAYQFVCSNGIVRGEHRFAMKYAHNSKMDLSKFCLGMMASIKYFDDDIKFYQTLIERDVNPKMVLQWLQHRLKREEADKSIGDYTGETLINPETGEEEPVERKFHLAERDVADILNMWNTKEQGTVNRRNNTLWSVLNTTTEYYSHKNSLNPDTINKRLMHVTSRVEDLSKNFDEEMELAHAAV